MTPRPALSIVLPVYNEADSLGPLWTELAEILPTLAQSAEVIFVDDGSTDGSADILHRLSDAHLKLSEQFTPAVAAYWQRLQARPAFQAAKRAQKMDLAQALSS